MFNFRRITLFCLEKRLSKHKMTNIWGTWLLCPPWLRLSFSPLGNFLRTPPLTRQRFPDVCLVRWVNAHPLFQNSLTWRVQNSVGHACQRESKTSLQPPFATFSATSGISGELQWTSWKVDWVPQLHTFLPKKVGATVEKRRCKDLCRQGMVLFPIYPGISCQVVAVQSSPSIICCLGMWTETAQIGR